MVSRLKAAVLALLCYLTAGCAAVAVPPVPWAADPSAPGPEIAKQATILYGNMDVLCSAAVIGPNFVATARHCVTAIGDEPAITLGPDGEPRSVLSAEMSPFFDVALLEVDAPFKVWATVTDHPPAPGLTAWVAGYGCDGGRLLGIREVQYMHREAQLDPTLLLLDEWHGHACHGDSGGGVFDRNGVLVGINDMIGVGSDNPNRLYTAPLDVALAGQR